MTKFFSVFLKIERENYEYRKRENSGIKCRKLVWLLWIRGFIRIKKCTGPNAISIAPLSIKRLSNSGLFRKTFS